MTNNKKARLSAAIGLLLIAGSLLSGCSCKEWGYCPEFFPNAERFAGGNTNQ